MNSCIFRELVAEATHPSYVMPAHWQARAEAALIESAGPDLIVKDEWGCLRSVDGEPEVSE